MIANSTMVAFLQSLCLWQLKDKSLWRRYLKNKALERSWLKSQYFVWPHATLFPYAVQDN